MARFESVAGLNERAFELVRGKKFKRRYAKQDMCWQEPDDLWCYVMEDGTAYYEAEQDCPWSSGPTHFYALRDDAGEWVSESLWTEDEIQAQI
jgi:hypothetical protein